MRALPTLDPLPQLGQVFDPAADNFLAAIGDGSGQVDSLLSDLLDGQNQLASGMEADAAALNGLNASLSEATTILDTLSAVLDSVDLAPTIQDVLANEDTLLANLDNQVFDLGSIAAAFLSALAPYIITSINIIIRINIGNISLSGGDPCEVMGLGFGSGC